MQLAPALQREPSSTLPAPGRWCLLCGGGGRSCACRPPTHSRQLSRHPPPVLGQASALWARPGDPADSLSHKCVCDFVQKMPRRGKRAGLGSEPEGTSLSPCPRALCIHLKSAECVPSGGVWLACSEHPEMMAVLPAAGAPPARVPCRVPRSLAACSTLCQRVPGSVKSGNAVPMLYFHWAWSCTRVRVRMRALPV